ncbi:hypothetical protein GLOTRDRAFT_135446 [Gloeophyllum trabeum ATCC 11539]|uniref:Uncharacterized protein n=1 Tax=Gloeophyllum trabeum (strain ATCC 11539 / FP-39264 / Madison 617) TaxID=670483 RepID=S7QMN9_GLOTA|nr:uncharacterized protein GLOTRDRAFT_135446 [Gloeophyllum trabeum ATCC 11539]EPQ60836.1 hypothetical protein GLOTRDRAFT_135446 [Gloeophyllum trabeum ATCC 11539]
MPSPVHCTARRRRSHSASGSPSPAPRFMPDDAWRCSTKRAHPHQPFSPSYRDDSTPEAPQKWDVDMWRRGKRARREASPENTDDDELATPMHWSSSSEDQPSPSSAPPTPGFACTPAAFNLFPSRKRTHRGGHHSQGRRSLPAVNEPNSVDMHRMRTTAFGDLRKSIAEGGEGFVLRMRDLEQSRTKNLLAGTRGRLADQRRAHVGSRRRPASHYESVRRLYPADDTQSGDEDDEIQIFVGENTLGGEPVNKKRAMSLGDMDLDTFTVDPQSYQSPIEESDRCSSPVDTSASGPSSYSSDDEEVNNLFKDTRFSFAANNVTNPFTPSLTHTYTNSTNSSLISLPLPPPVNSTFSPAPPMSCRLPSRKRRAPDVPSSASRSEKAIAALTLALANGAGDVNDYGPLSAIHTPAIIDDCEVGSMFD